MSIPAFIIVGSAALLSALQQNKDEKCGDQDHSNDDHDIDISGHGRKKIALCGRGKQCGEHMFHDLILFRWMILAVRCRYCHYTGVFSECQQLIHKMFI